MPTIHKPELSGAKAVYRSGSSYIRRDIIGWDSQGRPLVMCGGRLHPVTTAPFRDWVEFVEVEVPSPVDALVESVMEELRPNIYNIFKLYDIDTRIVGAISDCFTDHLKQMREGTSKSR